MNNTPSRDAKRLIHERHNILCHVQTAELSLVAKAWAKLNFIPQKVMLKAMSRYARIHHTN
mgnify:CR=1 FL=1|jgi:hypothetical protein